MENLSAIWHHVGMSDGGDKDGFPSDSAERFQVRMPPGLRDRIKAAAEANERSMNAEIVATLTRAYPASTRASEILSSLHDFILFHDNKIGDDERPVVHELFEELGRQIFQLEKSAPEETFEGKHGEVDAVFTITDPATGQEKRIAVEYKNSINYKDFAIRQLEEYLKQNPDYSGGVIVVGDERLAPGAASIPRPFSAQRQLDLDQPEPPAEPTPRRRAIRTGGAGSKPPEGPLPAPSDLRDIQPPRKRST